MNAAFFYGPDNIRFEKIDIERNQDSQLLKVLSCSICSYDVRTFRHGSFKVNPPIILGHEICAELLDDYQSNKLNLKAGTRVSIYPIIPCFRCWYCNHEYYNLCVELKEIGSSVNGGYAENILIPDKVFDIGGIVPVPDNISNEQASLIEPLACCINGINQIRLNENSHAVIIGDGPVGLMQLMLLKNQFKNLHVFLIGKINHRMEKAKKLGADVVISYEDLDSLENLKKIKEPGGTNSPNVIIVSNNNPDSLRLAFTLVNKKGKIMIFSGIKEKNEPQNENYFRINPNLIHYSEVSVYGTFSSTPKNLTDAMNLVENGAIDLGGLVTNTISLRSINEGLLYSENFIGLKTVINRFG